MRRTERSGYRRVACSAKSGATRTVPGITSATLVRCRSSSSTPRYSPTADQPAAIESLAQGIDAGERALTLLGATGTGKTMTMAATIEAVQKPALVIAHNKTLAAQLCNEFRTYFPRNAVEYFVSYYDYYQPEAYVPSKDLYIEKDSAINQEIDRLRHSATAALFARRDVLIVASVSCIYGLGSPEVYDENLQTLRQGRDDRPRRAAAQARLDPVHAQRHGAGARDVPGARRDARDLPRVRRDRVPDRAVRRRGRAPAALRPADRRADRGRPRARRDLAGVALQRARGHDRGRGGRDRARAERALRRARGRGQAARVPPPAPAHAVRHGDAARARVLLGDRELLADPRRPQARRPAVLPARLLPRRLRLLHRRVPPDGAADRRHVRGRPLAQADARRLRLPAAERARQPAADVPGVPVDHAADGVRVRDAGRVRAHALAADRRADRAPDRDRRPRGRGPRDAQPDRRPDERDPRAGRPRRAHAGDHADQEDVRGPDRLPARDGLPGALPALGDRHARADPDHPRAAAGRVRRARRRQPAPRGPRPARGVAGRDPRRRQGGLPARRDVADPDDRPRGPQRRRQGADVRRQGDRRDARGDRRDRPPPRDPGGPTTRSTGSRRRRSSRGSPTSPSS